jgi:hypothetical protein
MINSDSKHGFNNINRILIIVICTLFILLVPLFTYLLYLQNTVSSTNNNNNSNNSNSNSNQTIWTNASYPDLKIKYDSSKWQLSQQSTSTDSFNKGGSLKLNFGKTDLKISYQPIVPTGWAGPFPCYTNTYQVSSSFSRIKMRNFDYIDSTKLVDTVEYLPTKVLELKDQPNFAKVVDEQYNKEIGIKKEEFDSCGTSFASMITKTTLPAMEGISEDLAGKAWLNFTVSGDLNENILKETDEIIKNIEGITIK